MIGVEPKKGSSKKWWFIGCGGFLALIAILGVGIVVLCGMGMNSLKEASNGTVADVFGKSYQAVGYIPIGIPLGKLSNQYPIRNMVLLTEQNGQSVILAFDLPLGAFEAKVLRSKNLQKIDTYIQKFGDTIVGLSARGSSSNKVHDVSFKPSHFRKLLNGKTVSMSDAVTEMESKGQLLYSPGVVALVPESNKRLVTLFAMGGKDLQTSIADADFTLGQKGLEEKLMILINSSELDDRLQN